VVVQRGAAAGRVFIVREPAELDGVPRGAVLVARHDSSLFVRVMPFVSAIITETGTPTSHMAALSRELKVPTIVNAGNVTQILKQDEEVTVYAGENNAVGVYKGIVREILARAQQDSAGMENIYEFRKKRYILRYVSPLNLIDPLMEEFTPEGCKTMHDILRFIHEKAVAELVESARKESARLRGSEKVVKLDIPIPAGILMMDMGGGLDVGRDEKKATFEQVTSVPLRAIVKGMMHPGVWHSEAVSLGVNDFLSSMMRMSDIVSDSERFAGYNVAVISKEYVNLSLRFGYHFNMLDCYCGEFARNNHIYFRFVGGATDITKRSRRVELIATILREYGFGITTKGDLIVARLTNIGREEMEHILDQTGRLIAFTRQLDALLRDEGDVGYYAQRFLTGDYEV
jgi:pyruvate,water dikinase